MKFGRSPLHAVRSLDDVARFVAGHASRLVIIFDVDNTLAPQGADPEPFRELVNNALDRFEALPSVVRVIALSNGPPRGVPRMISRGNKPWTTRRRLGLPRGAPIIVAGDQLLTDGLLAWRLGATFLHLVIDDHNEAPGQRVMRRAGAAMEAVFFRRVA